MVSNLRAAQSPQICQVGTIHNLSISKITEEYNQVVRIVQKQYAQIVRLASEYKAHIVLGLGFRYT